MATRSIILIPLIIASAAFGSWLLMEPEGSERERWRYTRHLQCVQEQLGEVAQGLKQYRQSHGRYPTNEEGLRELDFYASRFVYNFYRPGDRPESLPSAVLGERRMLWDTQNTFRLRAFLGGGEPIPRTAKQFRDLVFVIPYGDGNSEDIFSAELGITHDQNALLITPAGILSPWWLPYVYENRNDHWPAGLPDYVSHASSDTSWAVKVAEGVYVWSVGGRLYQQKLDELRRSVWWRDGLGYSYLGLAVLLIVPLFRSTAAMVTAAATLLLTSFTAVNLHITNTLCYVMSPLFSSRHPEMTSVQRDLLEKHHAAGVIGEEAYRHALRAIDLTPTTPAQKPREARAD